MWPSTPRKHCRQPCIHTCGNILEATQHCAPPGPLRPHKAPTTAPQYMRARAELGLWFHELPPLATIRGAVLATDAGATLAGMAMALV